MKYAVYFIGVSAEIEIGGPVRPGAFNRDSSIVRFNFMVMHKTKMASNSLLASGFWSLASGRWLLVAGFWSLVAGYPPSPFGLPTSLFELRREKRKAGWYLDSL
jgi:hypothetical protein